jgi:hypothetical protein
MRCRAAAITRAVAFTRHPVHESSARGTETLSSTINLEKHGRPGRVVAKKGGRPHHTIPRYPESLAQRLLRDWLRVVVTTTASFSNTLFAPPRKSKQSSWDVSSNHRKILPSKTSQAAIKMPRPQEFTTCSTPTSKRINRSNGWSCARCNFAGTPIAMQC